VGGILRRHILAAGHFAMSVPHPGENASHTAERRWAIISATLIAFILFVIVFTGIHWAAMPPSGIEPIDPTSRHVSGEFIEPNLGVQVRRDGTVIVRLLAQQYSFNPQCFILPAHIKVTFRGTSADVVHGFLVTGTNANAMLVPGYITTFTTEFLHEGEHLMPCHEFCGTAHAAMWAHVKVIAPETFYRLMATDSGAHCD
jgi:cytochrome c oxidase subunit 2